MDNQEQFGMLDAIGILSFVLGLKNYQENKVQSRHNDVQLANDQQAKFLLEEINKRFDEEIKELTDLKESIDKLIKILEEKNG